LTESVKDALRGPLSGTGLGVDTVKAQAVDDGEQLASTFTSIFLILGLFSIMAGILLIVLIFSMLAAERRPEMGMARAVGTQRRQLVHQFVAEGSGYAILSGLVGSALGVGAAIGIANAMKWLFGQYVPIQPHVEPRSMVVAYCLGVVITFITVVAASWNASRVNVVAAIRDIPDQSHHRRTKRSLIWGTLLLVGGAFLTMSGHSSETGLTFYSGMSLMPFGAALLLRFFRVPSRPVFSLLGLYILVLWLLPEDVTKKLWGNIDGDFEMFFLSGIFMTLGATILIIQNTDLLLAGVSKLGGLFKSKLPAVRTAVAYPSATRGRTGMTIAMFSLIVFSLVMMATMSQNYSALYTGDEANAGWHVRADAVSADAVPDFTGELEAAGVDTTGFTDVGVTTNPSRSSSELRLAGTDEWKDWSVRGADDAFLAHSTLTFGQRAEGYATDAAIMEALRTEPNVAVIDAAALPQTGFGVDADAFSLEGVSSSDETFAPLAVELAAPDGTIHPVTIIGVIDEGILSLSGLFANQRTVDTIYPSFSTTSYYVALDNVDRADDTAKSIEAALLDFGVQGTSIQDEMEKIQKEDTGFLYLIEGFMGLGLLVGVAAVGVIAFRSVVERRQQIGVLRAIGYQRSLVSLSFLIETGFIVGVGAIAGTVLGVILAFNLFTSDDVGSADASFTVPWPIISLILFATIAVALLMTWIPSRQASGIAPAEALRYE
jgi:putative ABC transport system permease protein